jgi:serine/threonine protein kinase
MMVSRLNATSRCLQDRASSFVGTAEYVAPEIIRRSPYTMTAEWWSVGILAYEVSLNPPPRWCVYDRCLYTAMGSPLANILRLGRWSQATRRLSAGLPLQLFVGFWVRV